MTSTELQRKRWDHELERRRKSARRARGWRSDSIGYLRGLARKAAEEAKKPAAPKVRILEPERKGLLGWLRERFAPPGMPAR